VSRDFATKDIGFNHFLVYFTARMYWNGPQADVDAMLREYCRMFYGPAAGEMLAFFTYCEANWNKMDQDKESAHEALELFDRAKAQTSVDSVYGKRLGLINDYLQGLRMKLEQLEQKRGPVPKVRLVGDAYDIVIDGKLDDAYWQNCPVAATGRFRELQTGSLPIFGTSFKAGWQGSNLYFAIRCDERVALPAKLASPTDTPSELNIASTRDDDTAIWHGDAMEIELATETHSYYQIAISPAGHIVDLDRGAAKGQSLGWDSKAEVATHIAEDHWTVEIRFPITSDENDPLNQVVGRKPTQSLPWHINLCRQRIREHGEELSAFSPTGVRGFHEPLKFAHFYNGRSHPFESDPTVTDFALGFQQATRARTSENFLALAETKKISDFQKAAALEQAARFAPDADESIIARIPIEAVRKTASINQLLSQGKAAEVIVEFGDEDISRWPFWKRGDGYHLRGRAYSIMKDGAKAEADLRRAIEWISAPRTRDSVLLALAHNRQRNLGDEDGAFLAFQAIVADLKRIGSADHYGALQSIAKIQTQRGEYDQALSTLNRANLDQLRGTWREKILESTKAVKEAKLANEKEARQGADNP